MGCGSVSSRRSSRRVWGRLLPARADALRKPCRGWAGATSGCGHDQPSYGQPEEGPSASSGASSSSSQLRWRRASSCVGRGRGGSSARTARRRAARSSRPEAPGNGVGRIPVAPASAGAEDDVAADGAAADAVASRSRRRSAPVRRIGSSPKVLCEKIARSRSEAPCRMRSITWRARLSMAAGESPRPSCADVPRARPPCL